MSEEPGFIHLRARSAFSLAEGAIQVKPLAKAAAKARMPALAMTDVNNLFGALEFSDAAIQAGVQPIIGAIVTISVPAQGEAPAFNDEMVLLCQSIAGYEALCRLVTTAHLHTPEPGRPQVPLADILSDNTGLIALWGGANSALAKLLPLNVKRVSLLLEGYKQAFGSRLYLELQRCGEPWEAQAEPAILDLADKHGLPLVATNDVYFESREQHEAHDLLLCVRDGRYEGEENRVRITPEHYFKSAEAMRLLFADIPEALSNTVEIARRCAFCVKKRDPLLPVFPLPEGQTADSMLEAQARQGFAERYASVIDRLGAEEAEKQRARYEKRLQYELDVIKGMGFSGYFLIVSDFMRWTKRNGIPVGVRGSGATSMVAWCMYITHLDPIRFDLVFERFLNPERVSLPDFDIDFCQERRGEVIEYVKGKYGDDKVAQIITFGKLQAKAAVRDVGRVIGAPFPLVEKLSKLIGNAASLQDALNAEPAIKSIMEQEPLAERSIRIAKLLEGLYRHASTHAAGVIISDRPLVELLPLYKDPHSDMPVTQFHFKDAEKAGLVKFDFLGLRTLTIIARTVELVKQTRGIEIDIDALEFNDPGVYDMLRKGDVSGVFQLESAGMRDLLKRLRPERIEQLIALISLYRPGPMDSIPQYIARAQGIEDIVYDHPLLEKVLAETYGIITYQEDVMQIARDLAGYSLGEADLLRRAMGKKIKSEMDVQRDMFRKGATKNGVDQAVADLIFEKCAKFAGYGFNKGHAAAYAQVSYQTAFLKHRYELEFYAACMSVDMEQIERLATYARELRERGKPMLPPDINRSGAYFSIEQTPDGDRIRYGLAALKGVGTGVTSKIEEERRMNGPFRDLAVFFERCSPVGLSRSLVEQLAKSGAFDSLEKNRSAILTQAADLIRVGEETWREKTSAQEGLFGATLAPRMTALKNVTPLTKLEELKHENESIGFFVSGHPLDDLFPVLQKRGCTPIARMLDKVKTGQMTGAKLACIIHAVQVRRSQKSGNKYAFVGLSDPSGDCEAMVFSELLSSRMDLLKPGELAIVTVQGRSDEDSARLTMLDIQPVDAGLSAIQAVEIVVDGADALAFEKIETIATELQKRPSGSARIRLALHIPEPAREVIVDLPGRYALDALFIQEAGARWGECSVLQ